VPPRAGAGTGPRSEKGLRGITAPIWGGGGPGAAVEPMPCLDNVPRHRQCLELRGPVAGAAPAQMGARPRRPSSVQAGRGRGEARGPLCPALGPAASGLRAGTCSCPRRGCSSPSELGAVFTASILASCLICSPLIEQMRRRQ